ncbi:hypothetical protein Q3G72_008316 [Acer saccharum]|nr:hypothetical protein Q3G72_008316 [Acer saccharum]
MHVHDIDIDEYIHLMIYSVWFPNTLTLPFQCLVTYFCLVVGIPIVDENKDIQCLMGLFNRKTYNELEKSKRDKVSDDYGARDDQTDVGDAHPAVMLIQRFLYMFRD